MDEGTEEEWINTTILLVKVIKWFIMKKKENKTKADEWRRRGRDRMNNKILYVKVTRSIHYLLQSCYNLNVLSMWSMG